MSRISAQAQSQRTAALGSVVAELIGNARLDANMDGADHQGAGFPQPSI